MSLPTGKLARLDRPQDQNHLIGTAVVGVGYFGSLHAPCYARLPGSRLQAPVKREIAHYIGVAEVISVSSATDDVLPFNRAKSNLVKFVFREENGRQHGFSDASFYTWRTKCPDAKRLRDLEA
jgi:hypothetical protein